MNCHFEQLLQESPSTIVEIEGREINPYKTEDGSGIVTLSRIMW